MPADDWLGASEPTWLRAAESAWPWSSESGAHRGPARDSSPEDEASKAARAAGLSLLVPGLGQHRQGRARKWLFGAVEVLGWAIYLERRSSGNDLADRYRDFAWSRGRLQNGTRVDGVFAFYETLTKWTRSGAFDSDSSEPGLQPEVDADTYNGTIWLRAQGLFLGGAPGLEGAPGYEQARSYYEAHAYGEDFLWDWTGDLAGQAELGARIEESDGRFKQATTMVGVVLANHILSAVDAYLSRQSPSDASPIEFGFVKGPLGFGWSTRVQLPVGR